MYRYHDILIANLKLSKYYFASSSSFGYDPSELDHTLYGFKNNPLAHMLPQESVLHNSSGTESENI
jgi:hypothetical protein